MTEIILKTSMGALFIASVPLNGDLTLWSQWGLAGVVVGYTLWRDNARERRMAEAIERHQSWVQTTLIRALERNSSALEKMGSRLAGQEPLGGSGESGESGGGGKDW